MAKRNRTPQSFAKRLTSAIEHSPISEDSKPVVRAIFGIENLPPDLHAGLTGWRAAIGRDLADRALLAPLLAGNWCWAAIFDERWQCVPLPHRWRHLPHGFVR